MIEKIGNALLDFSFYPQKDFYSDGPVETELLHLVQNTEDYDAIIAADKRWPILYHLSRERENIAMVMDITGRDSVLEIGAGCGAVTGAFLRRAQKVDCVELSKLRSEINAVRHRSMGGFKIFVGNFEDIRFDEKYDVITLIGVLEYAKSYIHTADPYCDFLKRTLSLLKQGGRLYLAIENKFGLKYFAGCGEDHTGRRFEGIEGYPNSPDIRTFSYSELKKLFRQAGYCDVRFFYPYPDYKLPRMIYSDEYLPKIGELNRAIENYDAPRDVYFDEQKAYDALLQGEEFRTFSNSYLVEARVGEANACHIRKNDG